VALSFVLNDLLELRRGDELVKAFLSSSQNEKVVMKFAQFLNAFTKDYYARKYLCCEGVVKNAMALLKTEGMNEGVVLIIVSFLQQMTRKEVEQMMIDNDMIKWIISKLRKER
jgi:hypothetical protein